MHYIRKFYGVPAKRGARIEFTPGLYRIQTGTIIGSIQGRLKVRFDDEPKQVAILHPTWEVTYL